MKLFDSLIHHYTPHCQASKRLLAHAAFATLYSKNRFAHRYMKFSFAISGNGRRNLLKPYKH